MNSVANIIVYSRTKNDAGVKLHDVVRETLPNAQVEMFHTVSDLSEKLRKPALHFPITVLVASNREDLESIMAIQDLLIDSRVVLVLPDKEMDTSTLGHALRPRFVSYRDSSFRDVGAVLKKMTNQSQIVKA